MEIPVVQFKGVSFRFNGHLALDRVTATINRGDYVGLIGPNGAGKTTLVKVLLGLFKANAGSIRLFDVDIESFHDWHKIGYVPQKATSFDADFPATVEEVVAMGRFSLAGMMTRLTGRDRKRIKDVMRMAGITKLANRHIGELSTGQQQKVFIARALASDPELLILDEPTTGVDAKSQHEFYHFLHGLNVVHHLTLILISHDTDVVTKHVNKLLCLNKRMMDKGCTVQFLKPSHAHHGKAKKFMKQVRHKH